MSLPLVIGVDVGTQSVKAALFEPNGHCIAEGSMPVTVNRRSADEVDQEPEDFYRAATQTIRQCLDLSGRRPGEVAAIGVAGQMAGVLGIRSDGSAVTPYDSWLDSRCGPEVSQIRERSGNRIVRLTGCPSMVAHAPKMLWWRHHHPQTYASIARFVVPSAFVVGRLCGLSADEAFVDWTYLHFSGVVDATRGMWSSELAEEVGIDLDRMPRIVAPTDCAGRLSASAARECGLLSGTTVAAGLGDTAAGLLGAGVVRPGQALDTAGTASVLSVSVAQFRPDSTESMVLMRGAVPGQWVALYYLAGGDLIEWLPQALGATSLDVLVEEAASAPQAQSLLFVPHLGGRILPPAPQCRGAWIGLDLSQTRGTLSRAVLESIAFEYVGFMQRAGRLFPEIEPSEVRVIGGGASNSIWNRMKASALGVPYVRLERENFSCWGSALVAAVAAGLVEDLAATALATTAESTRVKPDQGLESYYAERVREYQAVVEMLVSLRGEAYR